ncbi:uncharacterized protein LOC121431091 isoform X2 [Lytechinus variegatus]|uniref:uncharacterized protein LOC121431091 isoform X2 n=1 Tax=Lytechinus variegatus TaxID=7654 RepID=UPI001BB1295A|nr:uncharacterized protein LOC121431091 isoform X2 [Lytechinus variegatus]
MGTCVIPRRGGISFDRADKTALYVRMLGDVIVHGKLVTTDPLPLRRGSVPENEYKAPQILPSNKIRRTSLQTPTVAAIEPSPTSTSASQAKQTKNDDGNDDQAKSSTAQHRTHPTVLLDAAYHGKAHHMLQNIGQWDFNIFKFDEISNGHSLRMVLFHLFEQYGLTRHFKLDSCRLMKSFELIEEAYYNKSKNPYHNSMHAADVCQAMHCYLQEEKLREALTPIEIMGALLGSAMHDLDHPGVNQKYLINSKHHLADLYQNSSILENHHWRVGISVLTETGLLDHLPPEEWKMFVDHIRSLILATDIARQQEFLSQFQNMLDGSDLNLNKHETRKFILQIALKCADICNPCRTWQVTEKWGNVVSEEFFRQGDREKAEELPISMNCNRDTTTVPQIQCGFIGFVVEPLFKNWARFMPSNLSESMLHNMRENKRVWLERKEKEQAASTQTTAKQNSAIQSSSNEKKDCKVEEKAMVTESERESSSAKNVDLAEPETKALKLSPAEEKVSMESGNVSLAGKHKHSAIRERTHKVQVHAHQEQVRPHSAVLSPQTHRALGVHRAIDVTLSDSNTIGVHSHSADNLRSASSTSAVTMRTAMEAKQRDSRSPKVNKRKSATENMLQGGFVGSRRLESFSLRLPRSPNTLRKELRFDDPWEKIEKSPRSPRSPTGDLRSPVGSPPPCIESPLLQRASHPLRISHTSPGLSDSSLHSVGGQGNNAIAKLGHGFNNNVDFSMPVDVRSASSLLHHNMSHNKQHDGSEPVYWQERGLLMYSEQNSVSPRNSKHFLKAALSPSSSNRDTGNVLEHRTKATPTSLLVRPTEGRGSSLANPSTTQHSRTEGYSSSLLVPSDSSGNKERPREKGSPFIRKRIVENQRKRDLQVPVISSGSLSPRVPPRGMLNIYAPTSPPSDHTPTSPPYSVPAALSPLLQDFTSNQLASIARRRQQMQTGDQPSPSSSTASMSHVQALGDRSPRVQRHLGTRETESKSGTSSTHDSAELSR